jgi:serine protease
MGQKFFLVIGILLISTGLLFAADDFKVKQRDTSVQAEYVPGEIVVKFKDNADVNARTRLAASLGTNELYTSPRGGFKRLSIPADKTVEEMVEIYRADPNVEYADPNYIAHADMMPNDTYYSYQWHMPMINMESAWDLSTGTNIIVAVIDGGVAYENYGSFYQAPDLAGTNFVAGYDFVNDDTHPNDDNAHGTHVTGTIAQTTNNNMGVTGVAFNCSIMPVKALDASGNGTYTDITDAIYWAVDHGAHVINMSLGGSATTTALQTACNYAKASGVVVVCAAGNDGSSAAHYPSAYPSTISVSAVTLDSSYTSYTNYGSTIDICAPGGDLSYDLDGDGYPDGVLQQTHDGSNYSTFSYYFYDGTSMATPHVSGLAALILAKAGGGFSLTPDEVQNILESTSVDLGASGWDQYYGAGLIDAYAAVSAVSGNLPPVANFSGTPTSGCAPLAVGFTDLSTNTPTGWSWTFGDGGTSTAQNPSHTYTSAGTYTVSLTVTNAYGSDGETKTGYITINGGPTAYFTGSPTSGDAPLTVNFSNGSTDATSWSWTFGDGGTSTVQNPSHTYTSDGTFTVQLTATNACGSDVYTRTSYITVNPCVAPTAGFAGSPTSGDYPLTVNFTDASTGASSWSWTFGDGGTSTAQNPSHTYTSDGVFTVGLTVTNPCGSDNFTITNYITVTLPEGDYASLPYSTGFETGTFDNYWFTQSSASVGRIQITTANTPHSGSYHMTMDVSSNGTYSQNEAWLGLNLAGKGDVDLTFWWKEFGDETHTQDGVYFSDNAGASFVKVYSLANGSTTWQQIALDVDALASTYGLNLTGTFIVKFQQYDNYSIATDGMAFDDINVISHDVPPVAAFSADPTVGYAPLSVTFTDASTNNPTSWSWSFGDGGTSTAQNPTHVYNSVGSYTVTLTATNAFGSDGETKTDYITVNEQGAWTVITYDDFEAGWGSYTDGGADCSRYTGGTYAHQGSAALDIQDNSSTSSSFYHTASYNVSGYSELEVEFWFRGVSMDRLENFWVQFYDGSVWQTVANYVQPTNFANNIFYNTVVTISSSQYNFPTNAKLRFMCDASNDADDVYIDEIEFRGSGVGSAGSAASEMLMPDEYELSQNYPNPFNPTTEFAFNLKQAGHVTIDIYNIMGQKVTTLVDQYYPAGRFTTSWDASQYASGVYFYRMTVDSFAQTRKMVLLK